MEIDRLHRWEVEESIVYATAIYKTIRSTAPGRKSQSLHVIQGNTLNGMAVYTKGKLVVRADVETYYVLVSSKRST